MSLKLSGNNSLSYIGVEPLQPPNLVYIKRDPISGAVQNADWRQFNVGTFWLNPLNNTLWILVKKELNIPLWIQLGITVAGFLQSLTTDDAAVVLPIGLNINLFGDANITTTGDIPTGTTRVTLNANISVTNITVGGNANITNLIVTGPITTNLSQGVVQSPGSGMALFASLGANGQVLISGGPGFQPEWANITSADATVVITSPVQGSIDLSVPGGGGGGGTLNTLTGNGGTVATAAAGNINVTTDNTTVLFVGSSNNLLMDFDSADRNLLFGSNFIGGSGTATDNTAMGSLTLFQLTNGDRNSALGSLALTAITTGSDNTAIGNNAGQALIAGNNNIALGSNSGTAWVNNSDNIAIGNAGDPGDAGAMKLGTDGTHTSVFVQGITGPVPAAQMVTVDPETGQLGRQAIPSGSGSSLTTILTVGSGIFNKSLAPLAATIEVYGWFGGAGGGSGRRGASGAASGGGGGAGTSAFYINSPGSFFGNAINYTVGAGGAGGAAQTADNSDGNPGGFGGTTFFGDIKMINPGVAGGAGGINGVASGGSGSGGGTAFNFTGVANTASGGSGTLTAGTPGSNVAQNGILSLVSRPGGGGGGADAGTPQAGGQGSSVVTMDLANIILAGGAGGIETGTINGGAGTPNSASQGGRAVGASGGGGGGGQSVGLVAGNGGVGGLPGGGGGGGGGSLNGTNSGAGGAGGAGLIIVIEHF